MFKVPSSSAFDKNYEVVPTTMEAAAAAVAFQQLASAAGKLCYRLKSAEEDLNSIIAYIDQLDEVCHKITNIHHDTIDPMLVDYLHACRDLINEFRKKSQMYQAKIRGLKLLRLAVRDMPKLQKLHGRVRDMANLALSWQIL